ncbi:MAG TPA: flagellar basal body P-ring protein FlgI [Terriglobia bacterium]|nr:flagellar basal body P-ring protein FlgI [Terriglobia bacterium]
MKRLRKFYGFVFALLAVTGSIQAAATTPKQRIVHLGDVTTIEGVRDNPLVGVGLVVGLNRTGDQQPTIFPMQTLANILQKFGIQTPGRLILVRNIAAVFVTAELPPFAEPGTRIDVNVSSAGDAKSLEGGTLLLTSLYGPDGKVYAMAQGPLTLGGYTAGVQGNNLTVNHPTSGRIAGGAIVERAVPVDLSQMKTLSLLLRQADFATSENVAAAINQAMGRSVATAVDSRRIDIPASAMGGQSVTQFFARIEDLPVTINPRAEVVVNERTGTIVMGGDVTIGAVSVMHGNLAIAITTQYQVSQPPAFSTGQTVVVPQTTVQYKENPAKRLELPQGATVEDLVNGMQSIGATPRDIVAILEAIKAAGALNAQLRII